MSADVDLLHFAVTKGLKEHVRILLEHGFVSFLSFLSMQYLVPCNALHLALSLTKESDLKYSKGVIQSLQWLLMITSPPWKQRLTTLR